MFDVSMIELAVIALVALLVLGPERLPRAARTVGFYVRRARQSWYSVKSEFERELAADELKRSLKVDEMRAALRETGEALRDGVGAARSQLEDSRREIERSIADPSQAPAAAEPQQRIGLDEPATHAQTADAAPDAAATGATTDAVAPDARDDASGVEENVDRAGPQRP